MSFRGGGTNVVVRKRMLDHGGTNAVTPSRDSAGYKTYFTDNVKHNRIIRGESVCVCVSTNVLVIVSLLS